MRTKRSKRKVLTNFDKWLYQPGTYIFTIQNKSMKQEQYPYGLMPAGYGHYTYLIMFRGKEYRTTTNNTSATDDYQDHDNDRRRNRGARALREEAIMKHNLK